MHFPSSTQIFSFQKYIPIKKGPDLSAFSSTVELTDNSPPNDVPWVKPEGQNAPQRLGIWGFSQWASLVTQGFLTVFPLLFITLAATAISLHEQLVDHNFKGRLAERAIQFSPTVFPIMFAAITGKFLRTLGLYLAQRGATLGTLERFCGSQSLFAALERQIVLRCSSILGIGIVFIWALSPVGGQSALRLLSKDTITSGSRNVSYQPMEARHFYQQFSQQSSTTDGPIYGSTTSPAVYLAALMAVANYPKPVDIFDNVKIPFLPFPESSETGNHATSVDYSSMLGIPIFNIPPGNSSFDIMSTYFHADCYGRAYVPESSYFYDNSDYYSYIQQTQLGVELQKKNVGYHLSLVSMSSGYERNTTNNKPPSNLTPVSIVNCTITREIIKSTVTCQNKSCWVSKARNMTSLEGQKRDDYESLKMAFKSLPFAAATSNGTAAGSSLTERWLCNRTLNFGSGGGFVNLSEISTYTLSRNVAVVINTFYQTGYWVDILTGAKTPDYSYPETGDYFNDDYFNDDYFNDDYFNVDYFNDIRPYTDSPNSVNFSNSPHIYFNQTQAKYTHSDAFKYRFKCDMIFASALVLISIFLLLEALATLLFMGTTIAPDIFGYVATCTQTSQPSVNISSHMGGLDRAKKLSHVRYIVGDVNVGGDIGHIEFVPALHAQRLRKDRLYD